MFEGKKLIIKQLNKMKNNIKQDKLSLFNLCENYLNTTEEENFNFHIYEFSMRYLIGERLTKKQNQKLKQFFKI